MKTVLLAEFGRFAALCKITHRTVTASVSLAAAQNAATGEGRDSVLHEVRVITRRKNVIGSWMFTAPITTAVTSQRNTVPPVTREKSDSGLLRLLLYYHWKRDRGKKREEVPSRLKRFGFYLC